MPLSDPIPLQPLVSTSAPPPGSPAMAVWASGTLTPERATTGDPVGVTVSTAAVQILASNAAARSRIITNNGIGNIYLGGANTVTASGTTMGIRVAPNGTYADSGDGLYTGPIFGIGDAVAASENVSAWERS